MAKEKQTKGFELSKEISIHVSADELWQMVGPGFENAHLWATAVDHSEGQGNAQFEGATCDSRTCNVSMKGFNSINEKITHYDHNAKSLSYVVEAGMPRFVHSATNHWQVVPMGANNARLVMNAQFHVKGLMGTLMLGTMRKQMLVLLDQILNDAKVYAETGEPSLAKKERLAKLRGKTRKAA